MVFFIHNGCRCFGGNTSPYIQDLHWRLRRPSPTGVPYGSGVVSSVFLRHAVTPYWNRQFFNLQDHNLNSHTQPFPWSHTNIANSISIIVQRDSTQSNLSIILQVHSTCFGCQPHRSWVHKTVTTASGTAHAFCAATFLRRGQARSLATLERGSCISTGGCSYSFVYSWWWLWLTPETCGVNLQINK